MFPPSLEKQQFSFEVILYQKSLHFNCYVYLLCDAFLSCWWFAIAALHTFIIVCFIKFWLGTKSPPWPPPDTIFCSYLAGARLGHCALMPPHPPHHSTIFQHRPVGLCRPPSAQRRVLWLHLCRLHPVVVAARPGALIYPGADQLLVAVDGRMEDSGGRRCLSHAHHLPHKTCNFWCAGKCHVWRHKNTTIKEGLEEKWERKPLKKRYVINVF